jgi:hypothetical protein
VLNRADLSRTVIPVLELSSTAIATVAAVREFRGDCRHLGDPTSRARRSMHRLPATRGSGRQLPWFRWRLLGEATIERTHASAPGLIFGPTTISATAPRDPAAAELIARNCKVV